MWLRRQTSILIFKYQLINPLTSQAVKFKSQTDYRSIHEMMKLRHGLLPLYRWIWQCLIAKSMSDLMKFILDLKIWKYATEWDLNSAQTDNYLKAVITDYSPDLKVLFIITISMEYHFLPLESKMSMRKSAENITFSQGKNRVDITSRNLVPTPTSLGPPERATVSLLIITE